MSSRPALRCGISAYLLWAFALASHAAAAPPRTNVVFILTDNQAAWTLGCYGNPDIRTPNIDRLAAEGTLFTRCFSSNAVCSPTRATYLTGLLPSQHGVHSFLRAGDPQIGPNSRSAIAEFRSLPQILGDAGYVCGLSGKWHLGGNLTPQAGFTDWVTMPTGHTTTFYNAQVIEDGKVRKEPGYLTDFWTDHAVRFIERNKDRPFFLYLAYNGPYGLTPGMRQPPHNPRAADYADKELKSFPRTQAHPWARQYKQYLNDVNAMRHYASEISGVDDGVGRVMDALRKNGLDDRTLVVFAADQGLCAGQHGIWGMGDHTRPLSAFDDMIHVPLIWRHPGGAVRAGSRSDLLVSNYDFLPTVLEYLGLADQTPEKPAPPGHSYAAALRGNDNGVRSGDAVFFEFENVRAIRTADWKYVHRFPDGPDELYDLAADPGEATNLAGRAEHASRQADLSRRLGEFFDRFADPKYDLSRGGTSKTPLHLKAAEAE
jgi:arylsulfatase A-like enzyme